MFIIIRTLRTYFTFNISWILERKSSLYLLMYLQSKMSLMFKTADIIQKQLLSMYIIQISDQIWEVPNLFVNTFSRDWSSLPACLVRLLQSSALHDFQSPWFKLYDVFNFPFISAPTTTAMPNFSILDHSLRIY